MSTWAYCSKCDKSLKLPTVIDAILGEQRCPQCDTPREVDMDTRRTFLEPLGVLANLQENGLLELKK